MPQEIRVVQCFQCEMFQVDIVKKTNKWQCKVCNIKQSLRKELFRGSGADCRNKVQELNRLRGESNTLNNILTEHNAIIVNTSDESEVVRDSGTVVLEKKVENKWDSFLDDNHTENKVKAKVKENSKQIIKDDGYDVPKTQNSKWNQFL